MQKSTDNEPSSDLLSNCDKEPICFIGSVQAHGAVLVFDRLKGALRAVSKNLGIVLGTDGGRGSGARQLSDVINSAQSEMCLRLVSEIRVPEKDSIELTLNIDGRVFSARLFFISAKLAGLELLEESPKSLDTVELNDFIAQIRAHEDLAAVAQMACGAIRKITGLQRVMLYRFSQTEWHGEVIAEDRSANAQSFLNHRFPADDIPKPARDLYLQNRVRFIRDSQGEASPLSAAEAEVSRIDLAHCRLRAVSPVHLEYLKNMGVRSSLSIAVIVDNALWGLFACHHPEAIDVSWQDQDKCLTIANMAAAVFPLLDSLYELNARSVFNESLFRIIHESADYPDPIEYLFKNGQAVLSLFGCSGMALVTDSKVDVYGMAPATRDCKLIRDRLIKDKSDVLSKSAVYASESIKELIPELEPIASIASGLLAIRSDDSVNGLFLMFRPETTRSIMWGGDPRKTLQSRNYAGRINPRTSFETWNEHVSHTSLPWPSHTLRGLSLLGDIIFNVSAKRNALADELKNLGAR